MTVSAAAEQSKTVCDNECVRVPERGRIDTVTRRLLVQVGLLKIVLDKTLAGLSIIIIIIIIT